MKRTILITGSTDGIGKLAAVKLAKKGHQIYLHGRNSEKLELVISEIKEATNNENIKGFVADFSDLEAVKKMAQQINEEVSKLDVLINNAGVFNSPNTQNDAGLDMRYVVNYFAPYLLTNELLPLLKKGTGSRIINLSSAAQNPVSYEALTGKEIQPERTTYGQSKLALTMWSFDLAKREKNITVIPVNPGSLLNTKLVQEAFGRHFDEVNKGSDILYELAEDEKHQSMSGKYFDNDRGVYGRAHEDAYNPKLILQLVETTKQLLN